VRRIVRPAICHLRWLSRIGGQSTVSGHATGVHLMRS